MIIVFAIFTSACGKHAARVLVAPPPSSVARVGATEIGVASWYGVPYHGRRAASGEIYDMEQLTAAHRQLPFQTWVEVTNLANGKAVDVRINDRGPFVHGRVIDLSRAAARSIDILGPGTAKVRLRVIPKPFETQSSARLSSPQPQEEPSVRGDAATNSPSKNPSAPNQTVRAVAPKSDREREKISTPETTPLSGSTSPGSTSPGLAASVLLKPEFTPDPAPSASVLPPAPPSNPAPISSSISSPAPLAPAGAPAVRPAWYVVQAGAFADRARAEVLRMAMVEAFVEARIYPTTASPILWRVVVGRQMTVEQANELARRVRPLAGVARVVLDPDPEPSTPVSTGRPTAQSPSNTP
jgi:rare lipoprotein A